MTIIDQLGEPIHEKLNDHERVIMEISVTGESMAAIGSHEAAIDSLVERGLMVRGDKFNNWISKSGRALMDRLAQEEDDALFGFIEGVKAEHGLKEGDVNPLIRSEE